MDILSLVVIVLILAAVIAVVTRPFFNSSIEPEVAPSHTPVDGLLSNYEAVLERIRELEEELSLGKVGESEYIAQRELLMLQAAGYLHEIGKDGQPKALSVDQV